VLANLLGQACTILSPGTATNGFGTTVDSWASPTTQTTKCRLQLVSGVERTDLRDVSIGRYRLFLPAGVTITEHDRVQVDGKTYEVINVYPVQRPQGLHHYQCDVETYSGEVPSA
jgi:hypothetical protein